MCDAANLNWPAKGDKAFSLKGHPADPALLAAFVSPSEGGYAMGFKRAADLLIEAAPQERTIQNLDPLVFPIAYLYRHYLELTLKSIIRMGVKSGAITPLSGKIWGSHGLQEYWNKTKECIVAYFPTPDAADIEAMESVQLVIQEFHDLDQRGDAFRYPTDRDGNPHLSQAPQWISLAKMKCVMEKVGKYLVATETGIDYQSK